MIKLLLSITLYMWIAGGLMICAIKPGRFAVGLAQAPVADSLLIEYIDDAQSLQKVELQLKRMRLLYNDMKTASESPKTFPKWIENNWFRVVGSVQDWNTVVWYVKDHSKKTNKPIPDGLLVFEANVEAGFRISASRSGRDLWAEAGIELLRTLAMVVAAKNGVTIEY